MLILKSKATINDIGTQVYIEFRNATGDYDVDDNPGGFGAPNPARNTLAVFIWAVHKLTGGDQEASVLVTNPLTVESFTVNITKDVNGVLNYAILALLIYNPMGSYIDGDVVWDNENPAAPFFKKRIAGEWVVVLLEDLVGDDEVTQVIEYKLPIPDACKYLEQLNAQKQQAVEKYIKKKCGKDEYEPLKDKYSYAEGLIRSANASFSASAFAEAQAHIDEIFNLESIK